MMSSTLADSASRSPSRLSDNPSKKRLCLQANAATIASTYSYEVALEAINDVIAGYSEQIALEQTHPAPNTARITWLEMRTDQAVSVHHSLNVCDDGNVQQAISEFSAIVRARDEGR